MPTTPPNAPRPPRPLRVVFHRAPEPDQSGPLGDILDLLAHGLASHALREARAAAEAQLGRPFKHATEPTAAENPVESLKRRVLRGT